MVAVGLFAFVMTRTSGAYLVMMNLNRQAQGIATGIDDLSYALEAMTRDIRTGSHYDCGGISNCNATSFSFKDEKGNSVIYSFSSQTGQNGSVGDITKNGVAITSPAVDVKSMNFYTVGTLSTDAFQPHVTIVVSGQVSAGPGKIQAFTVQTGATMRGSDI